MAGKVHHLSQVRVEPVTLATARLAGRSAAEEVVRYLMDLGARWSVFPASRPRAHDPRREIRHGVPEVPPVGLEPTLEHCLGVPPLRWATGA